MAPLSTALQPAFLDLTSQNFHKFGQAGLAQRIVELRIDGEEVLDHPREDCAHGAVLQIPFIESITRFGHRLGAKACLGRVGDGGGRGRLGLSHVAAALTPF